MSYGPSKLTHQALIDGPTTSVPRQAFAYRNLILTPYTIAKLPRGAGSGAIKKAVEKAGVLEKWESSGWAKKLAARQVRKVRDKKTLVSPRRTRLTVPGLERLRAIPTPTRQAIATGYRPKGLRQGEEGFGLKQCVRAGETTEIFLCSTTHGWMMTGGIDWIDDICRGRKWSF